MLFICFSYCSSVHGLPAWPLTWLLLRFSRFTVTAAAAAGIAGAAHAAQEKVGPDERQEAELCTVSPTSRPAAAAGSMFGHKTRGGNRGGADRFNWDDVKNDEHRENYLGHSLHGQIGRWTTTARGSDLTWWSEGRSQLNRLEKGEAEEAKRKELEMVKAAEEDAMREAMGLAPKNRAKQIQLDKHEIKALFARNATERDEVQESERSEGMGYKPCAVTATLFSVLARPAVSFVSWAEMPRCSAWDHSCIH
jgi:hypothetical protein